MKAITLRNLPLEVARRVRRTAQEHKTSANKAVIRLLEEQSGSGRARGRAVHHDLDGLAGSWSTREASAFDRALAQQRAVDEDMWK